MITKSRMALLILVFLVLVGVFVWNAPGVKSRRIGESRCNKRYEEAIFLADSESLRLNFEFARDICFANVAREYQNTQLCERIKNGQMKDICNLQVYYWDKSVEFCENEAEQKNACLHTVYLRTHDKSICSKISDASVRELCQKE